MMLKLGERLKELRKNKDITQEELAECLGVSYQAVSHWERSEGYPDITNLPLIASFFSISVDYLLGVDQERNQQRINEYISHGAKMYNKQEVISCIDILREALKEFPNSHELSFALFQSLTSDRISKEKRNDVEIAELGKRILSWCENDTIRMKTKAKLFSHYMYFQGDTDKAKDIANTLPNFNYEQTFVRPFCIDDSNEKQRVYQQMIMDYAHVVAGAIRCYIESNDTLTQHMQIELCQRINRLYDVLFDNEYDYDMLLSNNFNLAVLYVEIGEDEKAMESLILCGEYAEHYDNTNALSQTITYQTPLLDKLSLNIDAIAAFERQEMRDISLRTILLTELEQKKNIFKTLSNTDNFRGLIDSLKYSNS